MHFAAMELDTYYIKVRYCCLWLCNSKRPGLLEIQELWYVISGSGSASVYNSGTLKNILENNDIFCLCETAFYRLISKFHTKTCS